MTPRRPLSSIPLAQAMAASLVFTLAACGGGSGEAPPQQAGNVVSAAAPVVTITNNVSAEVATGDVTFTFSFNRDVGTSFTADDITVTGGTKGAFTRTGGTSATLVVSPLTGAGGVIQVQVAANAVTDAAGAGNAATSASKAYIAGQTITFAAIANQTLGGAAPALVATSTSGLAVSFASTTPSVCTVSGSTLTLVSSGTCNVTASQAGNANFGAATPVIRSFAVSGGVLQPLTFSTGFAANGLTPEGGAYLSYSGSNQDGFNCTGGPAFCGNGTGGSGATSFFFSYYQTPTPATDLYNGISVRAPGVTALSATADTAGVQINGQTTVDFTFNNNPEWQQSTNNRFAVELILGRFYDLDPGPGVQACNVTLRAVVTPLNNGAAAAYSVPLSAFGIIQGCNSGISSAAAALAASPVSEIAFKALAGNPAQPVVNGLLPGANLSVAVGGVYPTTLALTGGIRFGVPAAPVAQRAVLSTGFAANGLTPEGGAYLSYSGSNQDGFNCTGGPAFCGNGTGGSGATSFFFSYYQTPTPATDLYNGISVRAPGVTALSATADTAGVQINGQTTVNFTFNNNPEWQQSTNNNFAVELILGRFYDLDAGPGVQACNVTLRAVVTPLNNGAATAYAVPLSAFQIIQGCNSGISTTAAALASSPVSEVAFKALAGNPALPAVNGRLPGANLTVAVGGVYPSTLALTGGITFEP